jgi:amino acid transporter
MYLYLTPAHRSVLNVAFAYAGNQAFVTVMCEMRNPSRDFTRAILWLNAIAIPLYVIIGCVVYNFAGQYVVAYPDHARLRIGLRSYRDQVQL